MKVINSLFVVIVACFMSLSVRAEDVVLVSSLIPYAQDDTAGEDVRKECDWNATMPRYLAKESEGRVKVAEQNIEAVTGKKLVIVATNLHTVGGGGWTGPKWLTLEGKLTEKGKLLGSFEVRRQTIRGSMRGCGTLESLSEEVSGDILQWLKTPSLNAKLGDAKD